MYIGCFEEVLTGLLALVLVWIFFLRTIEADGPGMGWRGKKG